MELNEYQEKAGRTIPEDESSIDLLVMGALGLAGEVGELVDHIKKVRYHGHALDVEYIKKELGDILWYDSLIAKILELTLNEVGETNIYKLTGRYPDGFSKERSINRESS